MLYRDLEADRAAHHALLKRVAREKTGGNYLAAINEVAGGVHQVAVRTTPDRVSVEQVLTQIGLTPDLPTTIEPDHAVRRAGPSRELRGCATAS
jgi:hypothetical protein